MNTFALFDQKIKSDIILIYILWYGYMMTASITSWRQKVGGGDNGNMFMLPWLPCHNRLMKLSYFWRSTTKMIELNIYNTCVLYFVKGNSYEHSLIIYWTPLVY